MRRFVVDNGNPKGLRSTGFEYTRSIMPAVTVEIPETLSQQLGPYRENLGDLLWIGLNEVRKEQALALFKKGNISLWKAARLADVSLQEMMQYAAAQGLRATVDEETMREELA